MQTTGNIAARAYFTSQGWPTLLNGDLKAVGLLDKGELIAVARKYAIMLQTEFAQIVPAPKVIVIADVQAAMSRPKKPRAKRSNGRRKT